MKTLVFDKEHITGRALGELSVGVQQKAIKRVSLIRFLFGQNIIQVIERLHVRWKDAGRLSPRGENGEAHSLVTLVFRYLRKGPRK